MALLYMKDPLPVADLEAWTRPDSKRYVFFQARPRPDVDLISESENEHSICSRDFTSSRRVVGHTPSPTPSQSLCDRHLQAAVTIDLSACLVNLERKKRKSPSSS